MYDVCAYNKAMEFVWDESKRCSNLQKHGLNFADAYRAFTDDAFVIVDDREDYVKIVTFCLGWCMNALQLLLSPSGVT